MPDTVPVMLPVPRVMLATKRRVPKGEPERLCVLDDVPALVPSVSDADAPVALMSGTIPYRSFDGAMYRPLFSGDGKGCTPEWAANVLRGRAEAEFDGPRTVENNPYRERGERVVPIKSAYGEAQRNRGLRTVEAHQVRQVYDDGLAAQRAVADAAAANLLLVDGRLWHRAPCPELVMDQAGRTCDSTFVNCSTSVRVSDPYLAYVGMERHSSRVLPHQEGFYQAPWLRFMPHEGEKLAAYADALCSAPWHGRGRISIDGADKLAFVDAGAYATGVAPRTASDVLADSAETFLRFAGKDLHGMPDDVILAYVEARRAVGALRAGADPDEAYASIRPFLAGVDAVYAPRVLNQETKIDALNDAEFVHGARALMLRYEGFESPAPSLYADPDGDFASLGQLAP